METQEGDQGARNVTEINIKLEHPVALIFHLLFRSLAIVAYILLALFVDSFVIIFVVVILFLACDFWTVKNVTGRLLVGLRWWNEVSEEGDTEWKFESVQGDRKINRMEAILFWAGLIVPVFLWVLFALAAIVKLNFQWLLVIFVALTLCLANVYGYVRCAKAARDELKTMAQGYVSKQVMKAATDYAFGGNNNV